MEKTEKQTWFNEQIYKTLSSESPALSSMAFQLAGMSKAQFADIFYILVHLNDDENQHLRDELSKFFMLAKLTLSDSIAEGTSRINGRIERMWNEKIDNELNVKTRKQLLEERMAKSYEQGKALRVKVIEVIKKLQTKKLMLSQYSEDEQEIIETLHHVFRLTIKESWLTSRIHVKNDRLLRLFKEDMSTVEHEYFLEWFNCGNLGKAINLSYDWFKKR